MAKARPASGILRSNNLGRKSAVSEQLRDFDFTFLAHPLVYLAYLVTTPLVMAVTVGFDPEVLLWELAAAAIVVLPVALLFRRSRRTLERRHITLRMVVIATLIVISQVFARIVSPDVVLQAPIRDNDPGPVVLVLATAIAVYAVQHVFLWLLFTVLVAGSLNYRLARKEQKRLSDDVRLARSGPLSESALTAKQRDSVGEISRRIDAIEQALATKTDDQLSDLILAVRDLRQEVVRPSLQQLNALLAEARSQPSIPRSLESSTTAVPWRWGGMFFSGTVGGLLIGIVGLLLLAPTSYYFPGSFLQLGPIVLAFFLSVPASLLIFSAAALTPLIDQDAQSAGGFAVLFLIAALGAVSFLQRFNRVRQVRAVESMSVAGASLALDQVRRAQDLKVIEERVNSILHGSVQSTLLALELGLQSQDDSVVAHSADAIAHLRDAIASLDEPTSSPSTRFEMALDNILSVWAGSVRVKVDLSPESADTLNSDPLAASAVIEVVKEGTQNAVKHSDSREVSVVIGQEGSLVRVRVSHPSAGGQRLLSTTGYGIRYLQAITSTLRLVDDGTTTTLYAEIPTRTLAFTPSVQDDS
jgi:hypothetical protein